MAKNKREIDKELMFSKIMPSGVGSTAKESDDVPLSEADTAVRVPEQQAPPPAEPAPPRMGVQIQEKNRQVLVNVMEYLVVDKLDAAFSKFNCCKCDKCRKDVAAIALNKLVPKYVVTDPDNIHSLTAMLSSSEASTAIIQGILQVRAHPRH